jgi:hypothetical protein
MIILKLFLNLSLILEKYIKISDKTTYVSTKKAKIYK